MLQIECFTLGPVATNAYLIIEPNSQKAIIIDPGINPQTLVERIQNLHIEAILLTHAHFDHIGGVDEIRKLKNCPVYLHSAEAEWLTNPEYNGSLRWTEVTPPISSDPAEFMLSHGQTLNLLGQEFTVYHTPGHSPGSVSFHWGEQIFSGDVLFRQSVGRTDLPFSSSSDLVNSIHQVLFQLDPATVVYPGHGPQTSIGFEQDNNPFV